MASSAAVPKKFEWLVILPDHEGAIEKRLAVRPYVTLSFLSPACYQSPARVAQNLESDPG